MQRFHNNSADSAFHNTADRTFDSASDNSHSHGISPDASHDVSPDASHDVSADASHDVPHNDNASFRASARAAGSFSSQVIGVDFRHPGQPEAGAIQRAAEVVKRGGLLIFPTDTVYGLGCSAFHEPALERIFSLKERPLGKPLPVLVSGLEQLTCLIRGPVSPLAKKVIREFWPGALTLIFPASDRIPDLITAGTKTIGVRMPGCQSILDLITLTRLPLAATSVNISGMPVVQEMSRLIAEWAPKVDLILVGGTGGIASTVIDLTVHPPKLLREGAISAKKLQRYLSPDPGPD
ncbi:MAG: L-threonylcarbamoyladenylate synthase [bacterium]